MNNNEHIVLNDSGYGRGQYMTEALINFIKNVRLDGSDVEVTIVEVGDFRGFDGLTIHAEEILSEETTVLDGKQLQEMQRLVDQLESIADRVLVEALDEWPTPFLMSQRGTTHQTMNEHNYLTKIGFEMTAVNVRPHHHEDDLLVLEGEIGGIHQTVIVTKEWFENNQP